MTQNTEKDWKDYKDSELSKAVAILKKLGFTLDKEQVHISGERCLMSGYKLVLTGIKNSDNARVVIKLSSEKNGIKEITHEHYVYKKLTKLNFSYHNFILPKEILFVKIGGYTIVVTEFIKQEKKLIEMSLEEQFFISLNALKAQEGTHATAHSHAKSVRKIFNVVDSKFYINSCNSFKEGTSDETAILIQRSVNFLSEHKEAIEMYSGFLAHTDFVPHNIRISKDKTYLIDHTELHFGNKYESWARFINYMELYNPELAKLLLDYVHNNRTPEEYTSLRAMRIYKLCFLIQFHTQASKKTTGDLKKLSIARIKFWSDILNSLLSNTPTDSTVISSYKKIRDELRSESEKARQEKM